MDAGLLLAGVSTVAKPPGAPPGNKIEMPPDETQNEFKNILIEAEGKSSGEVAEAEPNAQPQNLDSTEEPTEQIKIEDLVSWIVVPLAIVPVDAIQAVETSTTAWSVVPKKEALGNVELINGVRDLQLVIGKVLPKPQKPNLDISAEIQQELNITEAVGKTVSNSSGSETRGDLLQGLASTPLNPLVTNVINAAENEPTAEQCEPLGLNANVSELPVSNIGEGSNVSGEPPVAFSVESDQSQTSDSQQPDSGSSNHQGYSRPEVHSIPAEIVKRVEQSSKMTSAQRQVVVQQLTQKIAALAANSVRNEVTVRMEPAELGTVLVQVSRSLGEFTASLHASDERLHQSLKESSRELATALTARTNSTVKIEVISPESTSLGTSSDAQRQPTPQNHHQQAVTKFYDVPQKEVAQVKQVVQSVKTTSIDLEG